MIDKYASFIRQQLNKPQFLLVFGIIFLVFQSVIAYIINPLGSEKVLQLQTTFSVTTFQQIISEWRAYGLLPHYFQHYYLDLFLHPLAYSLFLATALAMVMNRSEVSTQYNFVLFLPFLAGTGDIFENVMHLLLLTHTELINAFMVGLSACFANGKWLLCGVCLVLIAWWGVKAWKKNNK